MGILNFLRNHTIYRPWFCIAPSDFFTTTHLNRPPAAQTNAPPLSVYTIPSIFSRNFVEM
jgi:hypothetical protein